MKRFVMWSATAGFGYWLWRYLSPQHSTLVLQDRVVVITGASSGLGEALAQAFARRAARVVLVGRRTERLQLVERRIAPYADDTLVITADVTDALQRQTIVDTTLRQFERIDVLINCAGVSGGDPFDAADVALLDRILETNFKAAILLARAVLPHLLRQNDGYIVNIGSISGLMPAPGYAAYSAAKLGLVGFSDALRRELLGTNVQVLFAAPSWFRSEMFSPEAEHLLKHFPHHSLSSAEQVAESIVDALVQGRRNLIIGNWMERVGIWIERHLPRLNDMYWYVITRYTAWYEMLRKTG